MSTANTRFFSNKRASSSLSHTDATAYEPNPKRTKGRNVNARFDRMIETMAIIPVQNPSSLKNGKHDKDSRSAKVRRRLANYRSDSPPTPSNVSGELSFIKMNKRSAILDDNRPSGKSSSSKDMSDSPAEKRTCPSLPSWLANTFMSLSKKHPLRLLLPPDLAQKKIHSTLEVSAERPKTALGVVPTTPCGVFAFQHPTENINQHPPAPIESHGNYQSIMPETHMTANRAYIDQQVSEFTFEPVPFSTPGPGTQIGSTLNASTMCSSAAASSSPTLFAADSHADSCYIEPHTPIYSPEKITNSLHYIEHTDDFEDSDALLPEIADNLLFTNIFATPGPGRHSYSAPSPVHFDDPTEDPLSSSPSSSTGYKIPCDEINFQWKPFDRRKLTVPDIPKRVAFACAPTDIEALKTIGYSEDNLLGAIEMYEGRAAETTASPDSPVSSAPPISPSPFRFAPPFEQSENQQRVERTPDTREQQELMQEVCTPKKKAFTQVPEIYISPLHSNWDNIRTPKAQNKISNSNIGERTKSAEQVKRQVEKPENRPDDVYAVSLKIQSNDSEAQQCSQDSHVSNDSIESWN